ncbi:hypothetical protein PHYBOEH_001900 [Phytophthora boehmeriae]|uniref:Uncharacterized protein n=1 Tax=Phytophthora boehmeriae TaxID=109152 RepID=A0A8T1V3X6_9STRA|nr:hypothetical protein PHYBOEH_001900 [Phytophthora boehmeriae]
MTAGDAAWDEWEDELSTSSPATSRTLKPDEDEAKTKAHPAVPHSPSSDAGEWRWSLSELEQEMSSLPPSKTSIFEASDGPQRTEEKLLASLSDVPTALRSGSARMSILRSLAQVAQLHVLAARESFTELPSDVNPTEKQVQSITEKLAQVAGEWGDKELLKVTLEASERQQLEEMTGLLHRALDAENEGLTLFQEVLEQLFQGFQEEKLILPTTWLERGVSAGSEGESVLMETMPDYLQQILALSSDDPFNKSRMPPLSEAEIFQDAKDIGRDELLINGERVEGTRGYDAVVDALQKELEQVLARQVGKMPEETPMAVSNALQAVAMAVLHSSNRTESGGSAYELLAKFISNHEVDRVLLRPASARAAPLDVNMDVGPYLESVPGSMEATWAFGLRVKLTAVMWYVVCDADDPTNELYELETSFCNRLAFPVGLTPFHPLDSMRKDRGAVVVRFVAPVEA